MSFLPGFMPGLAGVAAPGSVTPAVETLALTTINSQASSLAVTMPSGIVAGNLLLVFACVTAPGTPTAAGWTQVPSAFSNNSQACITIAFYKIAVGGDTCTISVGAASLLAAVAYRISSYSSTPEGAAAAGVVTNSTPDPPNLAPSWGLKKTLWLTAAGWDSFLAGVISLSSYPASFVNGQNANATQVTIRSSIGVAELESEVASVNPGTFALSGSPNRGWSAITVAVKPL